MNGTQYGAWRIYKAIMEEIEKPDLDEKTLDALRFAAQVAENVFRSSVDADPEDWQNEKPLEIHTSDEVAKLWGVSVRRAQAHIATLHDRFGVGRKVGRDWLLSADEAERHPPRTTAGRPPKAE